MSTQRNIRPKQESALASFEQAILNFELFYKKSFAVDSFISGFFKSINSAVVSSTDDFSGEHKFGDYGLPQQ